MTTREWASELRKRQDACRGQSSPETEAADTQSERVWDDLRKELNSGIDGYGVPSSGQFERSLANHTWLTRLVANTPNRSTTLRAIKAVHKPADRTIEFSYSGIPFKGFSVSMATLAEGSMCLFLDGVEVALAEIAQKALTPFLE